MGLSVEQAALTRRAGFPIPAAAGVNCVERDLLTKHGYWLAALGDGSLDPTTPEQRQFVRVARGEAEPRSAFEVAWSKCQRAAEVVAPQGGPLELAGFLTGLIAARAAAATTRDEHRSRREAVLNRVKPELDALDAEYADRLAESGAEASRSEAEVRHAAVAYGESFRHSGVHAVYCRGRISWDAKGLDVYAVAHPAVREYRRVGEPTVSLRFDPPGSPEG